MTVTILPSVTTAIPWTDVVNGTPIEDLRWAQMEVGDKTGYIASEFRTSKKTLDDIFANNQFDRYYQDQVARKGSSFDRKIVLMGAMWGPDPVLHVDEDTPYGVVLLSHPATSIFGGVALQYTGCV